MIGPFNRLTHIVGIICMYTYAQPNKVGVQQYNFNYKVVPSQLWLLVYKPW